MLIMLKNKLKKNIARYIDQQIEEYLQLAIQMNEFINAPNEKLASYVESQTNISSLVRELKDIGISVVEERLNIDSFQKWMNKFPEVVSHYSQHNDVKIEKILEHYLVFEYLNIKNHDVYVDIAAANSPFSKILRKNGVDGYEQDLIYTEGINGFKIGGDASSLPVPENFADVLSLQCAFECFQGNSDFGFIKETGRVLKKGGRLGIVPLYMDNEYFVKTGPKFDKRKLKVEKEANWIWRDDDYLEEPFSRHYSPASFKNRVYDNLIGMNGEILFFTNLDELMKVFINQRIYCHFMFRAIKG